MRSNTRRSGLLRYLCNLGAYRQQHVNAAGVSGVKVTRWLRFLLPSDKTGKTKHGCWHTGKGSHVSGAWRRSTCLNVELHKAQFSVRLFVWSSSFKHQSCVCSGSQNVNENRIKKWWWWWWWWWLCSKSPVLQLIWRLIKPEAWGEVSPSENETKNKPAASEMSRSWF